MRSLLTVLSLVLLIAAPCALADSDSDSAMDAALLQATVVPADSNAVATPVTETANGDNGSCLPSNELDFLQGPLPGDDGGPGGGGGGTGGGGNQYTCSASVLCSGGGFIPDYVLTCQGQYSCSNGCSYVKCDGIGTLCFFGGANC